MDEEIATELIQGKLNHKNLLREVRQILEGSDRQNAMLADYRRLKLKLGVRGASERAARSIYRYLQDMS
jgi:lipid-A-disaccharide synthase